MGSVPRVPCHWPRVGGIGRQGLCQIAGADREDPCAQRIQPGAGRTELFDPAAKEKTMAQGNVDALRKSALASLDKQFEGKKAEIVAEETDIVPSSKETLHRFYVRPADEPNAAHATVVLDSAGKAVDLAKLSAAEGRDFFAAAVPTIDLPKALLDKVVTINPKVNDIQLTECGFRETVTVTIPAQPIAQKVDVYFLADNTGSMGPAIANVKAGASAILSTLAGIVPDIQFGVGNYHDFGDPSVFQNQLALTSVTSAPASQLPVLNAINGWSANFGGDTPESALHALHQVATGPIGWRGGSMKFIVWFGDAPSHEPICNAVWSGPFPIDRAKVISELGPLSVWATSIQPKGI